MPTKRSGVHESGGIPVADRRRHQRVPAHRRQSSGCPKPPDGAWAAASESRTGPPADEHRGGGPARGSTTPPARDPYGSARTAPPSIPSPPRPPARAPKSPNGRVAVGRGWGQIKRPKWGQVRRPKRRVLRAGGWRGGGDTRRRRRATRPVLETRGSHAVPSTWTQRHTSRACAHCGRRRAAKPTPSCPRRARALRLAAA